MSNKVTLAMTAKERGGTSKHVFDLARHLRAQDWDVQLELPTDAESIRTVAADQDFTVLNLGSRPEPGTIWHLHLHNTYDAITLRLCLKNKALSKARVILTEHLPRTDASDTSLSNAPRTVGAHHAKWIFKRLQFACVHTIITPSEGSKEFLVKRYGISPSEIKVVYNGIAVEPLEGQPSGSSSPVKIAIVGALIQQKGHDLLLSAAAKATGTWELMVIGEGPHRSRLEDLARASKVPVRFLGWRDDARDLIATVDAVCMPSRWESSGYAALEAMERGKAVIATRIDGLSEIVLNGETGVLVDSQDPIALAKAIDQLSSNPSELISMGERGRQRVSEKFGLEQMISATLRLYTSPK